MRAFIVPEPFVRTVAARGAATFGSVVVEVVEAFLARALAEIDSARPWTLDPDPNAIRSVRDACLDLASLEQVRRGGVAVQMTWLDRLSKTSNLDDLRALVATSATRKDLEALALECVPQYLDVRDLEPLAPNPTFALSRGLGGADADLVAAGLLIDFKSTARPSIIGANDVRQVLGYALADTDDQYAIREVAIGGLRWGSFLHWRLDWLLAKFSGVRGRALVDWRADFAALV